MATATTTDINMFNELIKTIADKSYEISNLTNKLLTATDAAAKLKTEIATIKRSNGWS